MRPRSVSQELSKIGSLTQDEVLIYGQGHYNPENDVLLRLETITAKEVRVSLFLIWNLLMAREGDSQTRAFSLRLITSRSDYEQTANLWFA